MYSGRNPLFLPICSPFTFSEVIVRINNGAAISAEITAEILTPTFSYLSIHELTYPNRIQIPEEMNQRIAQNKPDTRVLRTKIRK